VGLERDDWVVLGTVDRSRGRRGEVIVTSWSGGPETFMGRNVFAGERSLRVTEAWAQGDRVVIKLDGIDTIEDAETLRGFDLRVPREARLPLGDGEYYLSDLVGCEMFDSEKLVGEITGWHQGAAGVLLTLKHGSREALIPFVSEICREIDLPNRRIIAELPDGLLDL
jgi:16S rRNA processing protein RimM